MSVCATATKEARPGAIFAFAPWFNRGQCIKAVQTYAECRQRLQWILVNNVDALHQIEYSASATVLTLLPTIGALFGAPNSESWALLKICPPVGAMALSLSFGGSMLPVDSQGYVNIQIKQGLEAFHLDSSSLAAPTTAQYSGNAPVPSNEPWIHQKMSDILFKTKNKNHRLERFTSSTMVLAGSSALFLLFAGVMAGMAIVEQGAVYATWCTSTWWMHLWYIVVTLVAAFDAWIQRPFDEKWKIYMTERSDVVELVPVSSDRKHINYEDLKSGISSIQQTARVLPSIPVKQASPGVGDMLIVISVTTENKHLPPWKVGLQLFIRAGGLTIYVFATSVFAAVAVLALPMAQMILTLVLGAGLFGRAVVKALVSVIAERHPTMHIIVDNSETADQIMEQVLEYRMQDSVLTPPVFEVEGVAISARHCIGRRSRYVRTLFGLFARPFPFHGDGECVSSPQSGEVVSKKV